MKGGEGGGAGKGLNDCKISLVKKSFPKKKSKKQKSGKMVVNTQKFNPMFVGRPSIWWLLLDS